MQAHVGAKRLCLVALVFALVLLAVPGIAFGATVTRYEDDAPAVMAGYSAGWNNWSASGYTDGHCRYTSTANATLTFDFEGTGIEWYSVFANDQGLAEVWVDSQPPVVVDRYKAAAPWEWKVAWSKQGLANGPHTLHIRSLAQRSPGVTTGGYYVTVDALDVTVDPPVVSTSAASLWSLALLVVAGLGAVGIARRLRAS